MLTARLRLHDNVNGWKAYKKDWARKNGGLLGYQETDIKFSPVSSASHRAGGDHIRSDDEVTTRLTICVEATRRFWLSRLCAAYLLCLQLPPDGTNF
jgi:hypothetical protein